MRKNEKLPQEFAFLEEFIEWSAADEFKRLEYREGLTMEEIREFYDAVRPHVTKILDYLKTASSLGKAHDKETQNLLNLMKGLSDASLSVELHKSPSVPDGMPWHIWKPEHETSDWKKKPKIRLFPR